METAPRLSLPDAAALSRDLYYQAIHELSLALPPPVTDTAEDRIRRDNAMIACVASLRPANADEVAFAAQCVAANAQALDCLRLARQYPDDTSHVLKCTAQAASMMRQARAARTHLQRLQAAREARQSDKDVPDQAAAIEAAATSLIADAIAGAPAPPPVRDLNDAEKYALAHPGRAALIRSLGRLPKKFAEDSMPPALVHDIVNSDSPILQALAKKPPHRLAVAA